MKPGAPVFATSLSFCLVRMRMISWILFVAWLKPKWRVNEIEDEIVESESAFCFGDLFKLFFEIRA